MLRSVVKINEKTGSRRYLCPLCGGTSKKLTQADVYLRGHWPAPQVEVRECKDCGTLHECDQWLARRPMWRGGL